MTHADDIDDTLTDLAAWGYCCPFLAAGCDKEHVAKTAYKFRPLWPTHYA